MAGSCYTVRPGPESGWLTFFELTPDRRCEGFFLVVGPVAVSPDSRRMAQGMARQIVGGYKRLLDPDPATWLNEVRQLLLREQPHLEFGALVLGGERAYGCQTGRVHLVPLTAGARRRFEKDPTRSGEAYSQFIANGDRFFFGRAPRHVAASLPSAEEVQGVEQGERGDGALILTIHSLKSGSVASGDAAARSIPDPARPAQAAGRERPAPKRSRSRRLLILGAALLGAVALLVWSLYARK